MITSPNLSPARLTSADGSPNPWLATMAAERRRLEEDRLTLRTREQNLREYEARLRALQAEIEASRSAPNAASRGTSVTPSIFHRAAADVEPLADPVLKAAWEKLHRARELLEAEQAHMLQDRMVRREQEAEINRREAAVAARESELAEREAMAAANFGAAPAAPAASALGSLSRAPFDLARRMLRKATS